MIKVCHIVNLITGEADGVYKHLRMIFELSDKNRFEHFLVFQGNKRIEDELKKLGIRVFVIESLNKKISLKSFIEIYKILKEMGPEIIHTHLIKPYAIAGLLNILLQKKFVFNYHGIFIYDNAYYNLIEKLIYYTIHLIIYSFKVVNVVLVPSENSKQLLRSQSKLFPEPIVYYNGYHSFSSDKHYYEDDVVLDLISDIKKKSTLIALIGRLELEKRIDRALRLIYKIKVENNSVNLLIFGDGKLRLELQNLTTKLELNNDVQFLGYVSNLETYFRNFDIILFTSDWEGMPLTLWEAMANKVPIVAPDVGGFKEILTESDCGFIYDNLTDAKKKLLKLINDQKLRKKMGENGRTAIELKYNAKNFIYKIENTYSNLLE